MTPKKREMKNIISDRLRNNQIGAPASTDKIFKEFLAQTSTLNAYVMFM